MNPRVAINEHVSRICRQTVPQDTVNLPTTRPGQPARAVFAIGSATFIGSDDTSQQQARENAAKSAWDALSQVTDELQLRKMLGLPKRNYVQEMDTIRDKVRVLRTRVRDEVAQADRPAARALLGHFVLRVDAVEKQLMQLGLNM